MNWCRTILDGIILCIAFNGVVAFVWLLEPIGFSVMLPKGLNTPLSKITKKQIKPIRLMEFILDSFYSESILGFFDHWVKGPIVCAILSLVVAGIGMLIR